MPKSGNKARVSRVHAYASSIRWKPRARSIRFWSGILFSLIMILVIGKIGMALATTDMCYSSIVSDKVGPASHRETGYSISFPSGWHEASCIGPDHLDGQGTIYTLTTDAMPLSVRWSRFWYGVEPYDARKSEAIHVMFDTHRDVRTIEGAIEHESKNSRFPATITETAINGQRAIKVERDITDLGIANYKYNHETSWYVAQDGKMAVIRWLVLAADEPIRAALVTAHRDDAQSVAASFSFR